MAATTLATSLGVIGDKMLMEIIYEFFVKADPFSSRVPLVSDIQGYKWRQKFRASNAAAAAMGFYGTMSASAYTMHEFEEFMKMLHRGDQYNVALQSHGIGQQGFDERIEKQKSIFDALGKLYRQYQVIGEPATAAVGATLTALLGANSSVELGAHLFEFDDVHPQDGVTLGTTLGKIKWVNASASLSYCAPGDSYYGPAQVISSTNWYRVPLFSGADSSNNPNPMKWIRVTCKPYATILAAGNYESDTTAAKGITFTPSLQPTGLWRQLSPRQALYHDLTGDPGSAGTTAVGNGPASGGPVNRKNMSWLRKRLLDAAGGDTTRCAILAPENLITGTLEGLVTHLGHGVDPVMFMGSALNDGFAYGNIPVFSCDWIPTDLESQDGTDDLTAVMGVVLGEDDAHMKTLSIGQDPGFSAAASRTSWGALAAGDGTPTGTPLPVDYRETPNASSNLIMDMNAVLAMEMIAPPQALAAITHVYNQ